MSRASADLLKSDLALAGHETSCSLHYRGGFILQFANAAEVRRSWGIRFGLVFSVPGSIESARQVAVNRALARLSKATPLNPIHYFPIAAQPWHTTG
jgi:hypothetical protein